MRILKKSLKKMIRYFFPFFFFLNRRSSTIFQSKQWMIQFNGSMEEVMQQSRYPQTSQSKETHAANQGNLR